MFICSSQKSSHSNSTALHGTFPGDSPIWSAGPSSPRAAAAARAEGDQLEADGSPSSRPVSPGMAGLGAAAQLVEWPGTGAGSTDSYQRSRTVTSSLGSGPLSPCSASLDLPGSKACKSSLTFFLATSHFSSYFLLQAWLGMVHPAASEYEQPVAHIWK